MLRMAAVEQEEKAYSAYVTRKIVFAQLIPVLNVLLWVLGKLLNWDGHPADNIVCK